MKKSNQILKYSGLLLLFAIICFLFFGPKENIQVPRVNSEEPKHNKGSSTSVVETKRKRLSQATSSEINSKNQKSVALKDETFAEKVANRGGRFIGICDGLDIKSGNSEITRSLLFESKVTKQEWDEILGTEYFFSVRNFQESLPVNYEYLNTQEKSPNNDLLKKKCQLELIENLERAKVVALRSYYALILGRVLFENPKMFGDNAFADICEKLNNINENLSRHELNEIIYSYFDRAQVKAADVKFNPQFVPHVIIYDLGSGPSYYEDSERGNF